MLLSHLSLSLRYYSYNNNKPSDFHHFARRSKRSLNHFIEHCTMYMYIVHIVIVCLDDIIPTPLPLST